MTLTKRIFKIFTLIFIGEICLLSIWSGILLINSSEKLNKDFLRDLTFVDQSLMEGIILQHKMKNLVARDLIVYRLLELNNLHSSTFIATQHFQKDIIEGIKQTCTLENNIYICQSKNSQLVTSFVPLKFEGGINSNIGYLKLVKEKTSSSVNNKQTLLVIGVTSIIIFIINLATLFLIWWRFLKPEMIKLVSAIKNNQFVNDFKIKEFETIQDHFQKALEQIRFIESEKLQLEKEVEKMNLATQVAHDIRSPLEALKGLKVHLEVLPEKIHLQLQMIISRIEEISFNLLNSHRKVINTQESKELRSNELAYLIEEIIQEKSIVLTKFPEIEIKAHYQDIGLFSIIEKNEFRTILSNLVDNAIDALKDQKSGIINISLHSHNGENMISVSDNGAGIPKEVQLQIFNRGFTTKDKGNGLGLYHAHKTLLHFSGSIDFQSSSSGTTFRLKIPEHKNDQNFQKKFDLSPYENVIILDDDPSFHQLWLEKLECFTSCKYFHFYNGETLLEQFPSLDSKTFLLADYDLKEKSLTGIDIIKKLNHQSRSVLVTARYGSKSIMDQCADENINVFPKSLVKYLALSKVKSNLDQHELPNKKKVIVLIDDDILIHHSWALYFENKNDKELSYDFYSFKSIHDFVHSPLRNHLPSSPKTFIFIDSSLGKNSKGVIEKGELDSKKIFDLGFLNLFMVTGYEKEFIQKPHWIKNIFSKRPQDSMFNL